MKSGNLFYTNYGRVVHAYFGRIGAYVTDDFGNAVRVPNGGARHYIRQSDTPEIVD